MSKKLLALLLAIMVVLLFNSVTALAWCDWIKPAVPAGIVSGMGPGHDADETTSVQCESCGVIDPTYHPKKLY